MECYRFHDTRVRQSFSACCFTTCPLYTLGIFRSGAEFLDLVFESMMNPPRNELQKQNPAVNCGAKHAIRTTQYTSQITYYSCGL